MGNTAPRADPKAAARDLEELLEARREDARLEAAVEPGVDVRVRALLLDHARVGQGVHELGDLERSARSGVRIPY